MLVGFVNGKGNGANQYRCEKGFRKRAARESKVRRQLRAGGKSEWEKELATEEEDIGKAGRQRLQKQRKELV